MTQAWSPDDDGGGGSSMGGASDSTAAPASDDAADGAICTGGCNTPPGDCFEPSGTCDDGTCSYAPRLAGETCTTGCTAGGFCDAGGMCICVENCEASCTAGPNATAACNEMGQCIQTCTAPYDNCDGDWSNGCEVPVGVAHTCDANGLNPTGGCWTAYCGESTDPKASNFGTYHCIDCSTCAAPSAGQCHWCNHDTGNFFPTETCDCGADYLNLACGPA